MQLNLKENLHPDEILKLYLHVLEMDAFAWESFVILYL